MTLPAAALARISLTLGAGPLAVAVTVVAALGLAVYAVRVIGRSARVVGRGRASVLAAMRVVAFALVLVLLLGPILATSRAAGGRTRLALLGDRSRSMALDAGGGRTRAAEAAAAWEVARGAAGVPLKTYAVGRGLAATGAAMPAADSLAEGQASALGEALAAVQQSVERDGLAGVVVLSDGVSTRGRDPVSAARELGVPVVAVSVGSRARLHDVAVAGVNAPDAVYAGESTSVAVVLRARGEAGATIPVTVREGNRVLARATARVGGDGDLAVPLSLPPLAPGRHFLTAEAAPRGGEATRENNAWDAALDVRETRQKVLVVSGTTGWETSFLVRALSADPSLAVAQLVATPGGWRGIGEPPVDALPATAALFGVYRAVVLVNCAPGDLSGATQGALRTAVDAGTGLWWIAGPGGSRGTLATALAGALAEVLPVRRGGGAAGGTVEPALTAAGGGDALTSIAGDAAASAALWDDLPPVVAGDVALAPQPDARVLVLGRPSGPQRGGGDVPLIVARDAGGGRTLVWNGSGFWRWKLAAASDDKLAEAYGTVVQAAMAWLLAEGATAPLTVVPSAPVVRAGDDLGFTATLRAPRADARLALHLTPARGPALDRAMTRDARGDGFTTRIADLPPGDYTYRAQAEAGGRVIGDANGVVRVSRRSVEFDDVGVDEDALAAMARESGGTFVRADDASLANIVRTLAHTPREVPGARLEMWSHPATLVLLLLLLAGEWLLRKRWGLA